MSNQLRTTGHSIIGFDYNVVFQLFDILKVDPDEREYYLNMLKVIENVYLEHVEKQLKKKDRTHNQSRDEVQIIGKHPKTITGRR